MTTQEEEEIGRAIINAAYIIHRELGPGLLEKVYETCLAHVLTEMGFRVRRQVNIPIQFRGIEFEEGLRIDLLVNDLVIIELKAVETMNPLWTAQIISHLKLSSLNLGYLINFNVPLIKQGIKRFVN